MIKIVLLGAGNVAFHLFTAFEKAKNCRVIQVYNRTESSLIFFPSTINKTTLLSEIKSADLYIIAIADDKIAAFSETLPFKNKLVVHTSGSVDIKALSTKNNPGIFYPLQSFTKNTEVDFSEIPICIEADSKTDLHLLETLANTISTSVHEVNSEAREKLHLSAVIVNNFVNYLYQVGSDLLKDQSLSFDLLKPLIKETAHKIESLTPFEAQTGPAKRNDTKTIEKHLHLLKNSPHLKLYSDLTDAILKEYKKENQN